jgi:ankyrin repeat protein
LTLLIQHGEDVNGRDKIGNTQLFSTTTWSARLEAGQFLLSHGADIDARNRFNDTALIYAMVWGSIEFVRMLLERGAVIDARGTFGGTALHHAAIHSKVQFARLLLESTARMSTRATKKATQHLCPGGTNLWESRDSRIPISVCCQVCKVVPAVDHAYIILEIDCIRDLVYETVCPHLLVQAG